MFLVGAPQDAAAFSFDARVASYPSYPDAAASEGDNSSVAILVERNAMERVRILRQMRSDRAAGLRPIFCVTGEAPSAECNELSDGIVATVDEGRNRGEIIADGLRSLPGSNGVLDADRRLLHYLYARRGRILLAIRDWKAPLAYRYPILDAFADPDVDVGAWQLALIRRAFIAESALIDRTRHCPDCSYAHLGFVDRCPNCHGLTIERKAFLHCFRCGHVAPSADFSTGRMTCPKCTSSLKQIGVDYDRALESFLCLGCKHTFTDPEIVASCMHCASETAPEDLVARDVNALQLTDAGRLAARSGSLSDVFASLDELNYSVPDEFFRRLDWLLQLQRRYQPMVFSVMGVRFANVPELLSRNGHAATMDVIDRVSVRLREFLRDTDLSTRTTDQDLWMLLPFTDTEGSAVVKRKIEEIRDAVTLSDGTLDLRVARLTGVSAGTSEDGRMLVARLAGEMDS